VEIGREGEPNYQSSVKTKSLETQAIHSGPAIEQGRLLAGHACYLKGSSALKIPKKTTISHQINRWHTGSYDYINPVTSQALADDNHD
jgi:hypothetical protein